MSLFSPDTSATYELTLRDSVDILIIQFTKDNDVYPEEEFAGFYGYECWADDERYIIYFNNTGYICLKHKSYDGEISSIVVEKITKI